MIEPMMTEPAKNQLTFREYEQLPEGAPYQLIGGELTMTPSPTFDHQDVLYNLAGHLRQFAEERGLGKVVCAPIDVYLTETDVFQPDIIFISHERKEIIRDRVHGAPDLVIETLSSSTAYHDLVQKKRIYEQSGVKEYWIVDPQEKTIEVHENREQEFRLISKVRGMGVIRSALLKGFAVDVSTLF